MRAVLKWVRSLDIYRMSSLFTIACLGSLTLRLFDERPVPLTLLLPVSFLVGLKVPYLRWLCYGSVLIACVPHLLPGALVVLLLVLTEYASKSYSENTGFRAAVFSSIKHLFGFAFDRIIPDRAYNPDEISLAGMILGIGGLAVSNLVGDWRIGLGVMLICFGFDFLDGYLARTRPRLGNPVTSLDGTCDRIIESGLAVFYVFFLGNPCVTVILTIGLMINCLYLLDWQRLGVTLIRPYVVLCFVYPVFDSLPGAMVLLLLPFAVRIGQHTITLIRARSQNIEGKDLSDAGSLR